MKAIQILAACFFVSACGTKEKKIERSSALDSVGTAINSYLKNPYSDTSTIDVVYLTNRNLLSEKPDCSNRAFGVDAADKTSVGVCRVNVPKRHSIGQVEQVVSSREDSHRYFRFMSHRALDMAQLQSQWLANPGTDVLVFVHGFNVKFEDALMRAAQVAYDLKFQGQVVLFTWPAGAKDGWMDSFISKTYDFNRENAKASVPALSEFLKVLMDSPINIHLAVHSMGHQVVLPALAENSELAKEPYIKELILNAPDFEVSQFTEMIEKFKKNAKRVTVYCSYNDKAITASETYNKNQRLGACEKFDGVDTINVSEFNVPTLGLGHSYYSSRPILTDVYQVLLGIEAEKRLFIRKSEVNSSEDYYLRP